jgi:hypothetical protein
MYRSEALQIQLPPDNSMDALSTNVKAKKKAAQIPITIDFTNFTSAPVVVIFLKQYIAYCYLLQSIIVDFKDTKKRPSGLSSKLNLPYKVTNKKTTLLFIHS